MFRQISILSLLSSALLAVTAAGCSVNTGEEGPIPSKGEFAGKADADFCGWLGLPADCDVCDEYGWYGDGICDQNLIDWGYCAGPDPDCGGEAAFESFRLHNTAGPCPPGLDCNGFIELSADGTLRVDNFGELPSVVREYTVTDDELQDAINVLTDPELVAILEMDEAPCVEPTDIYESMTLTAGGEELYNSVTFCDDASIQAARDVLRELADRYSAPAFDSFRVHNTAGPCPPGRDCNGFIELSSDGTLRVDNFGELPSVVHEYTVTEAELNAAIAIVTDPELVAILSMDEPPCVGPTDIYESMELTAGGEELWNSVTFCDDPSIQAARDVMRDLAQRYTTTFESFRIHNTAGPCPPGLDCNGFIELSADGTLRVDLFGELPSTVHTATVTDAELADAIEVLTDRDLVALLELDESPCVGPTDIYESMTLTAGGTERYNSVTFCDDAPLQAARDTLRGLSESYVPR